MSWPITPADVRKQLLYTDSQGDDDDLQLYADAAMEAVEERVGPMRGQAFSSTLAGPATVIVLDQVFENVTVEADGTETAYTGDLAGGIITGNFNGRSLAVRGTVTSDAPATIQVCARELAAIWYRQANAGTAGRGPGRTGAVGPWVPLGFAIPREIGEKLAPFQTHQLPGIG